MTEPQPTPDHASDALVAALMEIERHVAGLGWNQPARLFALVRTADLVAAEPHLAETLDAAHRPADAFSSIEQDTWHAGEDVVEALQGIMWPESVQGCALVIERAFLPADAEADIPQDPDDAARYVAEHPRRQDIRVVAGVLRTGQQQSLARIATEPDDLLGGPELAPGLSALLSQTLR
ncbi:hypothetical protein GA0111570_105121 [Raineyella antarctica]|uniref:Uncharacterized protein n=1 Tax=Raineyella antarctica TaxID=1577474 RepID=A0A1G6GVB8_9ACTN|nr:PPA1309 family protein [Raineyella antarctica]SDB85881.1 hypothetical protein GA0111570_105121 [Raineyella antarctica]